MKTPIPFAVIFICIIIYSGKIEAQKNSSKKVICAQEVKAVTYFKIDSAICDPQHYWDRVSKFMDKEKIIRPILDGIKSGKLKVYDIWLYDKDVTNDAKARLLNVDTMLIEDINTGKIEFNLVNTEISSDNISQIAFKEDWIFDSESLKLEKKVVAICLFIPLYSEDGQKSSDMPLGWVKLKN